MAPELWFSKRAINFAKLALNNSNSYVQYVSKMGEYGAYSIMGGNVRWLKYKFNMNTKEVTDKWKRTCNSVRHSELIRQSAQLVELCGWRDRTTSEFLTRSEISEIIEYICTC